MLAGPRSICAPCPHRRLTRGRDRSRCGPGNDRPRPTRSRGLSRCREEDDVGILYLVSTPIGNLEDLSGRAGRLLGSVELVLAEDTRHTGRLLRHLEARSRLLSLHQHNEASRIPEVLERLEGGAEVALVSDAGTPLVSDPGERLVRRALDEGHDVVPIPGPSAVLAALVASGLPTIPFTFMGFLPRKGQTRSEALERIAGAQETVVVFESSERLRHSLVELADRCGVERRAAVAREMTKLHEEFRRGTLEELARYYSDETSSESRATMAEPALKGEITLVVGPADEGFDGGRVDALAGEAMGRALLEEGLSPSRAARELARRLGIARNQAYDLVQRLAARDSAGPEGAAPGTDQDDT